MSFLDSIRPLLGPATTGVERAVQAATNWMRNLTMDIQVLTEREAAIRAEVERIEKDIQACILEAEVDGDGAAKAQLEKKRGELADAQTRLDNSRQAIVAARRRQIDQESAERAKQEARRRRRHAEARRKLKEAAEKFDEQVGALAETLDAMAKHRDEVINTAENQMAMRTHLINVWASIPPMTGYRLQRHGFKTFSPETTTINPYIAPRVPQPPKDGQGDHEEVLDGYRPRAVEDHAGKGQEANVAAE